MPQTSPLVPPAPEPATQEYTGFRRLAAYRRNALVTWSHRAYEEDAVIDAFLGRPSILLNSADGIRRVLVDNAGNYTRTPAGIRLLRPIFGKGVFLSEGEDWKRQRKTIAPAFAPRALPGFARHVVLAADVMLEALACRLEQRVELLQTMQYLTLDVIGRWMLSMPMAAHGPRIRMLIGEYNREHARPYFLDFILPSWLPSPRDPGRCRFQRRWFALIDQLIVERTQADLSVAADDFFTMLAEARGSENGTGTMGAQLRDQIATMIVAGHETTAVALLWAFYLLARAPEVQDRVVAEADGVSVSEDGASEVAARLPVTRALVEEALRLYPPAFLIVRRAKGSDCVGGVRVKPGSLILIAP